MEPSDYRRTLRVGDPESPGEAVEEELAFHFQRTVEGLMAQGLSREQAEAEARRRFGDVARHTKTMTRIERRRRAMERMTEWAAGLGQGVAFAARGIRRSPGFALAVIATLALGIGANATMFGIVDRVLLSPPDHVEGPDRVKRLYLERTFLGSVRVGEILTYPDFLDFKEVSSFSRVAAWAPRDRTWSRDGQASRVDVTFATWDLFPLLGVSAERGRFFRPEEDALGEPLTAVVSHEFWRSALGGAPDALGRTLRLDDLTFTVIGVAPEGFTGVSLQPTDVWVPLVATMDAESSNDYWRQGRGAWWLHAVARMAPGATDQRAGEEATALHRQGRADYIEAGRYDAEARIITGSLIAARGPDASAEADVARWLTGVSILVLLIACANVASLLLARITERRREIAVRLAMGISRSRLMALQISEALFLALLGGAASLALAHWGGEVVRSSLLPQVQWGEGALSLRVLTFTAVASVLAGLLAGVLPVLQAREPDLTDALKEGARSGSIRHSRLRFGLSVFQAAFSVVLLVGAGLFVRSLGQAHDLDMGLDPDRLALLRLEVDGDMDARESRELHRQAADRVRRLGGVSDVAVTDVPYKWGLATDIRATGWDSMPRLPGGGPYYLHVTPEYFRTLGLELVRGRGFSGNDRGEGAPVAVVSETMARTLWPDEGALGKCLYNIDDEQASLPCMEVVGVVEDASRGSLVEEPFLQYYKPLAQWEAVTPRGLYVRTADEPEPLLSTLQDELRTAFPQIRFVHANSLRGLLERDTRAWRLGATMFTVFGLLALVVAAMGLFSVLAFDVAQRTHELGVRSALGASRKRLVGMVLGSGLRLTLLGVLMGCLVALAGGSRIEPLLFRISPTDPTVYAVVVGTLVLVGALASLVPALRATGIDPVEALRTE